MIDTINSDEKEVWLTETVGEVSKSKRFSSFKALEKALQRGGIPNQIKYPLLKHGKVISKAPNGEDLCLELKDSGPE